MVAHLLEHALYVGPGPGRYALRARSTGFHDDWLSAAVRLCDEFGERPAGVACPGCMFAQPWEKRHLVVVQVADQAEGGLGFWLLVLPRQLYEVAAAGDPFAIADQFPPPWEAAGSLDPREWPHAPVSAPRRVRDVQRVLTRADGPTFLGAAQALVDGGWVVFERPGPDTTVRDLWTLLPTSTRARLWPASFAFANTLGFHAVAVPDADGEAFANYLREEQAGDYPEGRYETELQYAAEAGDQSELDRLFARRSRAETFRLGLWILAASVIVLVFLGLFQPRFAQPPGKLPAKNAVQEKP